MKKILVNNRKTLFFLELFLIFCWLANLMETDSYYSVYLLCAVAGVACLCDNARTRPVFRRWILVLTDLLAALFALAAVLANYPLFEPITGLMNLFNGACSLAGGFFLARGILVWALFRLPAEAPGPRPGEKSPALVFALFFAAVAGVFLLFLFTTGYPVYLAADSITSLEQIQSGIYSNHHPYWYTRFIELCLRLGLLFTRDGNALCAVYSTIQCLIMAACFAYTLLTLYQAGVPRWCVAVTFLMYTCLSYNLTYSITMWKDTLFGGFSLLLIASLYRLLRGIGRKSWLNYLVFALGGAGFCLVRNNGLPVFLILAAAMVIFLGKKRKKLLLVAAAVLVFSWVMTGPVLSALGVSDTEIVEMLGVPLQQIARVVANDCPVSESDRELLENIFWLDRVKELYSPEIVDPIKFEAMRPEGDAYISEHLGGFLGLWARLGRQNPGEYLKAWVELTKGFWNGGYSFWIYIRYTYPDITGIGVTMENPVRSLFEALFRYTEKPVILQPLYSIGLQIWVIIGCCFVCFARKREEFLTALPLVVLAAVLWVMTPVYAEFRYAYPMFAACPLILFMTAYHTPPAPSPEPAAEVPEEA